MGVAKAVGGVVVAVRQWLEKMLLKSFDNYGYALLERRKLARDGGHASYDLLSGRLYVHYKARGVSSGKDMREGIHRDRLLQPRWQRRQVRRARQAHFGGRGCGTGITGGGLDGMVSSVQAAAAAAAASRQAAAASALADVALKEAIRRSLADKSKADAAEKAVSNDLVDKGEVGDESAEMAGDVEGGQKVFTPKSAKNNFCEDAKGIESPVAENLGATLHACAVAIDDIVSELDSKAAKCMHEKCPPENPSASPIADSVSAMTSSISSLDINAKKQEVAATESGDGGINDDDWSMVSENSATLAKATEAIGSALFELDKQCSGDIAGSGIDSIPSSVPTVSSPAPTRWKSEIKQLRELGFTDDKVSVEALELLSKDASSSVPVENLLTTSL